MTHPEDGGPRQPGEWARVCGTEGVGSVWVWDGSKWRNLILGVTGFVARQQAALVGEVAGAAAAEEATR